MSEEFFTPDSHSFLPPTTQGSSRLEVKITEKTGIKSVSRTLVIWFYYAPISFEEEL